MCQNGSFALPIERLCPKTREGRLSFHGGRLCPHTDPEMSSPAQAYAGHTAQLGTLGTRASSMAEKTPLGHKPSFSLSLETVSPHFSCDEKEPGALVQNPASQVPPLGEGSSVGLGKGLGDLSFDRCPTRDSHHQASFGNTVLQCL